MEELLEITESQLIEAFWQWNKDSLVNPEKFSEITASKECAIGQTKALLLYLQKPLQSPNINLSFGEALSAIKNGKRATREGWNGKGMFIFMRPADKINIEVVAKNIKSLPQSVKDYYLQDILDDKGNPLAVDENDVVEFTPYLCMKDAQGRVVNGWLASQTDILAEDWEILD